jgi:hypothetical protein
VSPRRYGVCVCHLKLSSHTSSRILEKLLSIERNLQLLITVLLRSLNAEQVGAYLKKDLEILAHFAEVKIAAE